MLALLLSVPPVNALFHGTHMIVAHSMGSMIGIDTMVLFACCAFMVQRLAGNPHSSAKIKGAAVSIVFINACLFVFWCSFLAKGFSAGMDRYHGKLSQGLLADSFPAVMALSGLGMACGMFFLMYVWGRAVWKINLSVVPEDVDKNN